MPLRGAAGGRGRPSAARRHSGASRRRGGSVARRLRAGTRFTQITSHFAPVPAPSLTFVPPMLPTLVDEPPTGWGWSHEIKHDGYRTLLLIEARHARALSRQGRDWSADFAGICRAAGGLGCRSAILDGETVVLDDEGRSDFGELRRAIHGRQPLVFFAFDLLHLDGEDLRRRPLVERRGRLLQLAAGGASCASRGGEARLCRKGHDFPYRGRPRAPRGTDDGPCCRKARSPELRRERGARWVKPELVVGVKHLKGTGGLRHASVRVLADK